MRERMARNASIRLLRNALRSILRNRMRSLLTALGIIIGVSAVIIMVAVGQGSEQQIRDTITSLGTNLIIVYPGAARTSGISKGGGSFTKLTFDDVTKLRKEATTLGGISPVVRASGQMVGNGNNWFSTVYGVTSDYFRIRNWGLEKGTPFDDNDVRANRNVVLLGKTVADELFPSSDPLGKQIRIRNTPFTVVGVLREKGQAAMGNDQDDVVLAPATTVFYRLRGGQFIDMINVAARTADGMTAQEAEIESLLRESHRLNNGEDNDFTVRNQADLTETASATAETMTLLLASIAGVSLLVGGIGIMNIMLVSVTERTREIGIRMSVGARAGDVMTQFLVEAAVLSCAGGAAGILLAVGVAAALNAFTSLAASVSGLVIVLAFLFSGAVGIFFGYYPARKAAGMNPVDALRYE
jgi:putative ABC transport system permease protein